MPSLRTAVVALAAAAIAGVQATEVELPPCLDPFQPFVYSGCFEDTGNPSALVWRTLLDQNNMTVEDCVATCKGNGYRYAGLAYYGVCYCGQTVNGPQVDESQCSFPCSGNSSQTCGADRTLSVYTDPTFLPLDEVDVEDYSPLGCWTDDSSLGRALTYRQNIDGPLTTEKCLQQCRNGGFPFAGTEYAGECWCGIVIGNDTFAAPAEECNMACSGDSSETCGGPGRLNLYVAKELQSLEPCGYVPPEPEPTTTTTATTAETTSATVPPASDSTTSTTTAPTTTASPTTTTTPPAAPTTTTSALCVSTTTVAPAPAPTCEYKCGNWCSEPLPDWKDLTTCKSSFSSCKLQVASCFKKAGFPGSLECFAFADWCSDIERYCLSTRSGWSKTGFCKNKPPKNPSPAPPTNNKPTTTVYTTTCAPTKGATTTTKPATTTTTQCPIPTPTNICKQPSSNQHGYGPGNPIGGIELPIVTCNDLSAEYDKGYPFKRYSEPDSRKCAKYPRNGCVNACADACKDQYEDCIDVYAETCRQSGKSNGGRKRDNYFEHQENKRTFLFGGNLFSFPSSSWGKDDFTKASEKCKAQYQDCLYVNRGTTGGGKCTKFAVGPW
ncbi:WSC domain-containing protein [Echria macrotheca]|uniref:WSC domain-containing protein n=1 Tax=Echria macrotheca TaxID=438768 RepID=A0AAJ0BDA6_9PEZI|nr:WSC domain-containing protein [Echria macrotheca]